MREALAEHMREYQVEHAEMITKAFSEFYQVRADSCDASWGPGPGFALHARRLVEFAVSAAQLREDHDALREDYDAMKEEHDTLMEAHRKLQEAHDNLTRSFILGGR